MIATIVSKKTNNVNHTLTMMPNRVPVLSTPRPADLRPRDCLGDPMAPLAVESPLMAQGLRTNVSCLMPDGAMTDLGNVLMRADNPQVAYSACFPSKEYTTLSGHVEICHVLKRMDEYAGLTFKLTPRFVAVKVAFQSEMDILEEQGIREDSRHEISIMQQLGNIPHVATCLAALLVEDINDRGNTNFNLVMPHFDGGDLSSIIFSPPHGQSAGMSEDQARPLFRNIVQGLRAIHDAGICHADISPHNVVVDHEGQAIIIDFGMALRVPYTNENGHQRCLISPQGAFGKLRHMAPEIYANRVALDSEAIDVWSAGTILWCMVTGHKSYEIPSGVDELYRRMVNQLPFLLRSMDKHLSTECVHLLRCMLRATPRMRYSIDEVLKHPWMQQQE
eukprot:scaffold7485_cov176-Amphora_coffeaeformis.AAC.18